MPFGGKLVWVIPIILAVGVQVALYQGFFSREGHQVGNLLVEPEAQFTKDFELGSFVLRWENGTINIFSKASKISKWFTIPGAFIQAGQAELLGDPIQDGHYFLKESITAESDEQSVTSIALHGTLLEIKGSLKGPQLDISYTLFFQEAEPGKLGFVITVDTNGDSSINRLFLSYGTEKSEGFFGFGQHYSKWDLKGHKIPVIISEQGVGRGLQPLTFALNTLLHGVGSDWHTTYVAKPIYVTSRVRAFMLRNNQVSIFDLRNPERVKIELWATTMEGFIFAGESPLELIRLITTETGRMKVLPKWVGEGAIVGIEGGQSYVENVTNVLLEHQVPMVGVWLQDWVGLRHSWDGTRLIWNWEVNREHYPSWDAYTKALKEKGVRNLIYINPYLVDVEGKFPNRRNLFKEAVEGNYFVMNSTDQPLIAKSGSIEFGTIDPTNPKTRAWLKAIIKENMLADAGSSGWMADFGEYVPFDSKLHLGSGEEYHNLFPLYWSSLQQEAVAEAGLESEVVYFVRSGSIASVPYAQLYWVGDQLVTWDEHDGIKTVLLALMSGGLVGNTISSHDIGGYTMIDHAVFKFYRSKELLLRWIELGAFSGAVYRTHYGSVMNTPSAQAWDDLETINHLKKFATLFSLLAPYRQSLMQQAEAFGFPLVRSTFLHFPDDPVAPTLIYQYLFGEEMLIAPVLDPGKTAIKVYFPPVVGGWVHLWTGKAYGNEENGIWSLIEAPLGRPPVFYRYGWDMGEQIRRDMVDLKLL